MERIFTFCLIIFGISLSRGQDCAWDKDLDYPVIPPLFIDFNTWQTLKAVNENGTRVVRAAQNSTIVVACSGTTIALLGVEVAEGYCSGGQNLNIGGADFLLQSLGCANSLSDSVLNTSSTCGDQNIGETVDIGFDVPGYQFYTTFSVCFEFTREVSVYVQHTINGLNIDASDGNPSKPSMETDSDYFPLINPNECYLTASQDVFFTNLTGDPNYIDLNTNHYFARGHLAANSDFVIDVEADSSYHYLNAAPDWQIYNAANQAAFESDTRDLALLHRSDLTVYTGPWENLVLDDVNGTATVIYLCDSQGFSVVPVPRLLWKVVYEASTDRGLAVISSNLPYEQTQLTPICPDIGCDTISWITFNATDISKGYTYCCTVQDFRVANPNAPDLGSAGVLTD